MINSFTTRVNLRKETEVEDSGIFVDLLVDGNFKLIFSNPANKDILISLLNEFIPSKISDLKLVMQEKRGRQTHLKNSVFDLDCEFDDGRTAVVEVQFNSRADYLDRMLYYSTWPISQQKLVSEKNYTLKEVYIISFCNFALVHDKGWDEDKVVSSYSLREDSNGEMMTGALHFIYVELARFRKEENELKTQLESFLYYLKNMGRMKMPPKKSAYAPVDKMVKVAAVESLSQEDRTIYDRNMRNQFDIRTEKLMVQEQARAEGLAEGKAERSTEIARIMKADGVPIESIAKYSGLTEAEIKAL